MTLIERDEKVKQLKRLIDNKTIGNAEYLGNKIDVSRRTVFRLFKDLEAREKVGIEYSQKEKYFYFNKDEK